MVAISNVHCRTVDLDQLSETKGRIAVLIGKDAKLDLGARRVNRLTKGAIARVVESERFEKAKVGDVISLNFPVGLEAEAVDVVIIDRKGTALDMRKAGVALAKARAKAAVTVLGMSHKGIIDFIQGVVLRSYSFDERRSAPVEPYGDITVMHTQSDTLAAQIDVVNAIGEGVFFTRDLTNEPANILTTTDFADRLSALTSLGIEVEVLEEPELEKLGMRTLLAVGQGSASPSKVVVMQWKGGAADDAPLALVGKGVVFDTGGISLKPGAGMEDMTMDMGGAAVVAGVMKTLALRGAKANVVATIGLVENMPSSTATRPGDVITSMKGDTVEIINTDAEGRMVLCDAMWYTQDRFKPAAMIDLATLTGAVIIALGHDKAAIYSNNDALCNGLLTAADRENEGAWRMPLAQSYDDQLKSRVADMKNVGTRAAGSITAAQFLKRFVKDDTPWAHIDIAGVAQTKADTDHAPSGSTGWGVMTLNTLVADMFETE